MKQNRTPSVSSFRPIEQLEARRLLSGNVDLVAAGFEPIVWNGQTAFAKPGQFVLSLDQVHGRADQQLNVVNKFLGNIDKGVKATRFLGADGLTLIETPRELKHGQLKAALRNLPGFRSLEPDFAITSDSVNDAYFSLQWGLDNTGQSGGKFDADVDGPEAWNIHRGDGNVVVGVIDSRIDYNHPDLASAIWNNPGEVGGDGIDNDRNGYVDDIRGWNFYSNNNNPMDDNGHGTHVAGTIAAGIDNGQGVAGVANARVMALKFLGRDGTGSTSGAIAAVNYATKMRQAGVNIPLTNNSWGSGASSQALYDAIKANGEGGMLFVAAAGNGGSDGIGDNNDVTPNYPANYKLSHVISLAATDRNDNLGGFSNFGTNSVHLGAPGVTIASTVPGGYAYMDGTSMASPHVAGAAALAFSYAPTASAAQVKSALLNGVDPIASMSGKSVTGGRLNAHRTLQLLAPAPTPAPTTPAAPGSLVASGGENTISLTWADNSGDEVGFRIERSSDGGASFAPLADTAANIITYTDKGLPAATQYVYRVSAFNTVGLSAYSNTASATTNAAPVTVTEPAAPSGLTASAASASQIRLGWIDQSNNETGFKVERSTNGSSWSEVATLDANTTTYLDGGLKKKTTYYYRLRAFNTAGHSAYTATASSRTPAGGAVVAAGSGASLFSTTPVAQDKLLAELT